MSDLHARNLDAAINLDAAAPLALCQTQNRQLLAGFLLTLASTAATLVDPYLTMPLMDKVLIPFQNGQPIDWPLVSKYLGGLFAAALVAWLLG